MITTEKPRSGFEALMKAANAKAHDISPKVRLMWVILANKYFYIPDEDKMMGYLEQPPLPVTLAVAYEEIFDPTPILPNPLTGLANAKSSLPIAIKKHENMWIANTGFVLERVNAPKWWADRDKGALI